MCLLLFLKQLRESLAEEKCNVAKVTVAWLFVIKTFLKTANSVSESDPSARQNRLCYCAAKILLEKSLKIILHFMSFVLWYKGGFPF